MTRPAEDLKSVYLAGMRLGTFLSLAREVKDDVVLSRLPVLTKQTVQSLFVELMYREEERQLGTSIEEQETKRPLFILGLPRSGTTLLHYLFCRDQRFGFATTLQVLYPQTFFFLEGKIHGPWARFLRSAFSGWRRRAFPATPEKWNRGFDNVVGGLDAPNEEDTAMLMLKQSPTLGQLFPAVAEKYSRYLRLRELEPAELERWKIDYSRFVKKLTLRQRGRPLVLKSPQNTARVKYLLELFPEARFVSIHRHPHRVCRSFQHMQKESAYLYDRFRGTSTESTLESFLSYYHSVASAYLEDRELIPAGQLHELKFEDLVREPVGEMSRAYERLGLPQFTDFRPSLQRYLEQTKDYKKNQHKSLSQAQRETINHHLGPYFEAFGYSRESE